MKDTKMVVNTTIGSSTDYGENSLKIHAFLRARSASLDMEEPSLVGLSMTTHGWFASTRKPSFKAFDCSLSRRERRVLPGNKLVGTSLSSTFHLRGALSFTLHFESKFADGFSSSMFDTYLFPRLKFESPFADDTSAREKSGN